MRDRTLAAADKAAGVDGAGDPGCRWTAISSEEFASPTDAFGARLPAAQAEICSQLAQRLPGAHILLLTRGFRSVLVSGFSQYVRGGGDKDFYVFRGKVDPEELAHAAHAWNYDYLVRIYGEAFGGRVIALPYELLRDDPAGFVRSLEARLDVGACDVPMSRINPSLTPYELRWYPRMTRMVRRIARLVGGDRLVRWHTRKLGSGAWRAAAHGMQFLVPAQPVSEALVTDTVLEFFRGRADVFRDDPAYAPYRDEYLMPGAH